MATPWDAPPSEAELMAAGWDTPPTPDELGEAAPTPEKPLAERAGTAVRQFFDPGYGKNEPASLEPIGRNALKAASFLVPASRGKAGASLGMRMLRGAGNAAPAGALYGLGSSESDTLAGNAADALAGATGAGFVGAFLPVGVEVAKWGIPRLKNFAVEQGRKALSGIGTALSARKEIPAAAVEAAYATKAIRPFSTVGGIAERLGVAADDVGQVYGQILKDLEAKGVTGPNAQQLAADLLNRSSDKLSKSLGSAAPGFFESAARELATKQTLPTSAPGVGGPLPLSVAEEIKRNLQFEAMREYDKISRQFTTIGESKKELASVMRQAIEDAVEQQAAKAPAESAAFQPVKENLSNILQAKKAAEEGAARAARRKSISLTSTIVGSGAGAATQNPAVGLGSALLHGIADRRLASTAGSGARYAAKGLEWLTGGAVPAPLQQAAAIQVGANPETSALVNALRRRIVFGPSMAPAEEGQ